MPIRSHGRDPLHRGSASHKIDGVQAARGRLFFSEAEKSERGTVPMHRTGTAAAGNACRRTPQYTDGEQQFSDFQHHHHPAGRKQATACKPPEKPNQSYRAGLEVTWKRVFFCPEFGYFRHSSTTLISCVVCQQFQAIEYIS